jgi:hypothetical protein
MDEIIEALPVPVADRPLADWSVGELIADNARLGAMRLRELLACPVYYNEEGKLLHPQSMRIVREAAASSLTLYVRVAEGELKARQGGELIEFLERLNALREASYDKPSKD